MERVKLLIYFLILVIALLLIIKYWKSGRKN